MSPLDEVDAILQQGAAHSATMHRLGRGEGHPSATEREMIELSMSMSDAMSRSVRLIAAELDALCAVPPAGPGLTSQPQRPHSR
jgi:hypothetical protein